MEEMDVQKLTLVAVDTNILLDLAGKIEVVIDCLDTIKKRVPNPKIIVLPTVILELTDISECDDDPKLKTLAQLALASILDPWGFLPVNCLPVGHGIVEQIGKKIREKE